MSEGGKSCPQCGRLFGVDVLFCPVDGAPLRSANDSLEGQIVAGRYRVERQLGKGAMGTVYLAQHVHMRRWCALKVIRRSDDADSDAVTRFHREAANASRIEHPNVAAVYDFGEDPTRYEILYLAMEYIEGEPLHGILARESTLAIPRAVDLIRQAADGLAAAHEREIVHRDLKPDNIMIRRNRNGSETVKLVDFGIARVFAAESQRLTRTGLVIGTPAYMSPEQLTGFPIDVRSDIYSLALVAFRMLTGGLPFHGKTPHERMLARLSKAPQTLAEARADQQWPAELQRVFDRALAADPDVRYQTATEFAADLARAAVPAVAVASTGSASQQRMVPAEPPSASMVVAPAELRSGGVASLAAEAADLPSHAALGAERAHTAAAKESRRRRRSAATIGVAAVAMIAGVTAWAMRDRIRLPVAERVALAPVADSAGRAGSVPTDSVPVRPTLVQRGGALAPDSPTLQAGAPTARIEPRAGRRAAGDSVSVLPPADDSAVGASRIERVPSASAGEVPSPPAFDASAVLDSLKVMTDPARPSDDNARQALRTVASVMPRLTRKTDSVVVSYYAALARLQLEDTEGACRILRSIRGDAAIGNLTRAVDALLADGQVGCR